MTNRYKKLRSVFLTILLVCSLVAVAGPLAGTGSAVQTAGNTTVLTPDNTALYYGQEFGINVSQGSGSNFTAQNGDSVHLLELDEGGDTVSRISRVLTVNSSGYINLETGDLDASARQQYALNNDSELNGDAVNFTLNTQTLDTEWEGDSVASDSESATLSAESNRGRGDYNVTIRADGFDYKQLRALFIHPGTNLTEVTARDHLPLERVGLDREDGDGLAEMRSAGYLTLNLSTSSNFVNDGEIVANFSNLETNETLPDDGEYEFETLVTDSNARDTATVRIGGVEADFERALYTRAAGDVAAFTVELDSTTQTWVQLRDTNSAFVDVLYLEDDDGDGEVTFYANTRLMGTNHSRLSGVSAGDADVVYHSNDDTVQSYIHDEVVPTGSGTAVGDATFYDAEQVNSSNEVTFAQYVDSVNGASPTGQLPRPLQPTTYELVIDRRGRFTVDDGQATVDRPLGVTELDLVQPVLRESDTWVAPAATADSQRSISRLERNLTSRETAAIGDRLVLRFNTTGIVGALATIDYVQNGNSIDTGLSDGYGVDVLYELAVNADGTDWEGDGVNFTLLGEDRLNRPRERLALDSGTNKNAYVLVNQQTAEGDPGNLYAVIDTGSDAYEGKITGEKQYDAELTYIAGGRPFTFSGGGPQGGAGGDTTDPAFPYYDAAVSENASERRPIEFAPTSLTFDAVEDGTVTLRPSQNAEVSGETNLAPGTPLTVTVRLAPPSDTLPDEDPSFLAREERQVNADGTFNATLDLSSRNVGEVATVRVENGLTAVASSDAEFADIGAVQGPYFETDLDVPATAQRDETVNITGTVTNTGEESGTADVTIAIDGINAVRGVFDIETGTSRQIEHSVQMGQRDIDVSVTSQDTSQSATVEYDDGTAPSTATPTPTATQTATSTPTPTPAPNVAGPQATPPPADGGGGGFPWLLGGVGAVVTLAGAAVLVIRWL